MSLTGEFTSTPEGHVKAQLNPENGRFEAPFTLSAQFGGKDLEHGEYRQYIRGYFKVDGIKQVYFLCGNIELDEVDYREDGCGPGHGCTAYGHRGCPNYRDKRAIDEYLPKRKNGGEFAMLDIPGMGTGGAKPGTLLEYHLEFRGVLIDVRTKQELARAEWSVGGAHRFAVAKRSEQVTKLASGKTLHVRLHPDDESGWRGTFLISGPELKSDNTPELKFGVRAVDGSPMAIDVSRTGDLVEVGNPRNRTWNISFTLVNGGEDPAEIFGQLDGEEFEIALEAG